MPRAPKHFKIHCSIGNHRKTSEMAGSNDLLAIYVRLGILAIQRFADQTGDTFIVNIRELPWITGKKRSDSAKVLLQYLVDTSPILVRYSGDTCLITIPNFAKKQGFGHRNGVLKGYPATATATATSKPLESPSGTGPNGPFDLVPPKGRTVKASKVWTAVNEALKAYLPRSTGLTLTDARRRRMILLVKSFGPDAPIRAIHGYAALHLTSKPDDGFDPLRNFNPDTCWRPSLVGKYLDADSAAFDAGLRRPYVRPASGSDEQARFIRIMEALTGRREDL